MCRAHPRSANLPASMSGELRKEEGRPCVPSASRRGAENKHSRQPDLGANWRGLAPGNFGFKIFKTLLLGGKEPANNKIFHAS
jgi:hypothetical protein